MSDDRDTAGFGRRLQVARSARGPLCVGIDPHPGLLDAWGLTDSVVGLERFAGVCAEALAPVAGVIKPQSAFFERYGARGVEVLERTVATCREAGAQVVLDVKRGDIGSTVQAYADAYLHRDSPLAVDAVTVSPYLGFGSLAPLLRTAAEHEAGVFVLALTSNPEAAVVQRARTASGATVAGEVLAGLRAANADGAPGAGSFGAVVGATIEDSEEDLDVGGPLLVPGIGAQGGTPDDVRRLFAGTLSRVWPSSSREVLSAGPGPVALRDAALRLADSFSWLDRDD